MRYVFLIREAETLVSVGFIYNIRNGAQRWNPQVATDKNRAFPNPVCRAPGWGFLLLSFTLGRRVTDKQLVLLSYVDDKLHTGLRRFAY